jgi:hypothetical protein
MKWATYFYLLTGIVAFASLKSDIAFLVKYSHWYFEQIFILLWVYFFIMIYCGAFKSK